jgi:hypothetical protein
MGKLEIGDKSSGKVVSLSGLTLNVNATFSLSLALMPGRSEKSDKIFFPLIFLQI